MAHQRADAADRERVLSRSFERVNAVEALITAAEEREKRMAGPAASARPTVDLSKFPAAGGAR